MECKFCKATIAREDWCESCERPQKKAEDVTWTDKTCRRCYRTGGIVLDEMSPYCVDCRISITQKDDLVNSNKEERVTLRKEVRWLQSWVLVDEVTHTSAFISWMPPEFINDDKLKVDTYYVYSTDGEISEQITSQQIFLEGLEPGKKYEICITGYIDESLVNKTLKKQFQTPVI